MLELIRDEPGRLFLIATLLPLLAFFVLLIAGNRSSDAVAVLTGRRTRQAGAQATSLSDTLDTAQDQQGSQAVEIKTWLVGHTIALVQPSVVLPHIV